MESNFYLEVRTPDKEIFNGEIDQVILPGKDGMFGILKNHAPLIATLKKGIVKIDAVQIGNLSIDEVKGTIVDDPSRDKHISFEIEGGVVEVLNNHITILLK
jgi:F-type H+-transporting ATPase subunit epsilon